MLNRMIMGASALVLLAGVALAQQAQTPPPPQDNQQMSDDNNDAPPPPDQGWGKHWRKGHNGGMDGGRMDGPRGGPPPMMMAGLTGFRMHLGKGIDVDVMCGKDAVLKDCIAASQPLIDAAKAAATAQPAPKAP